MPPSVGEPPPNPAPSQFQQPKGGGRLVSTHAALSPELGSKLKARSGRKSGTTAPGVQGAGRGPLATSLVTFLFAQESNPPVGAGPDNPSGRMPENPRRGGPSSRGSQPTGMQENHRRGNPSQNRRSGRDPTTPPAGCREILRRGNPSSRGSQPGRMPENPRRENPSKTTGGSR